MRRKLAMTCLCLFVVLSAMAVQRQPAVAAPLLPVGLSLPAMLLRQFACATRIAVELGKDGAYVQYEEPIFWTFNFSFFPGPKEGTWYGCLRFYFRDTQKQAFVAFPASAVPILCVSSDTGNVVKKKIGQHAIPSYPKPDRSLHPAYFGRFVGGYIKCEMNVKQSLAEVASSPGFARMLSSLRLSKKDFEAATENATKETGFGSKTVHQYGYFTTIAAVAGGNSLGGDNSLNPLVYYVPDPPDPSNLTKNGIGFAIPAMDSSGNLAYRAALQGDTFLPENGNCLFTLDTTGLYAWSQFDTFPTTTVGQQNTSNKKPSVSFAHSDWDSELSLASVITCPSSEVEPPVTLDYVPFNVGPSTLYIGYDPSSGEVFKGDMYEVFFDPDSAVKG